MQSVNRKSLRGAALSVLVLVAFIVLCSAVAGLGGLVTGPAVSPGGWYETINKPFYTPPSWLFGPVWSILFLSMAVAGWLVWRERRFSGAKPAFYLFGIQLSLNFLWSAIFFGLQAPGVALVEILVLWVSIFLTILAFGRVKSLAAWILTPYLAWVTFATFLNLGIWLLNTP